MEKNPRPKFPILVTEKRAIKRITIWGVLGDAVSAFNLERGLVFTLKLLVTNPGGLLHQYLNEGRFRIFNGFRLLILTTAVSLFLMYLVGPEEIFGNLTEGWDNYEASEAKIDPAELQHVFFDWYNILLWIAIPIYALFSYMANRKAGYNYAEHVVMQSFHISAINVITIVLIGFSILISVSWMFYAILLVSLVYYLWMLTAWIRRRSVWFILKNVFAFLLANLIYVFVSSGIAMVILLSK